MRIQGNRNRSWLLRPGVLCDRILIISPNQRRQKPLGFTLLEALVSLAVAGTLLATISLILHDVGVEFSHIRKVGADKQYWKVLDIIAMDARGILKIEPIGDEAGRGEPLARFTGTTRINAIHDDLWMGHAHIGYWLADYGHDGKVLWRSESLGTDGETEKTWTCLMEDLSDFRMELSGRDGWNSWPKSELEHMSPGSLRITAVTSENISANGQSLPIAVLPVMVTMDDEETE